MGVLWRIADAGPRSRCQRGIADPGVQKAGTSTTVTSSPNPSVFSQSVTLQATVSVVLPGTGTPTGNVTFKDGTCAAGTVLGPASLDGSGQAT